MKLRNLFLASLAVCTMASCSKDDDGISGPQEVDAYLSFASTTDAMTKASTEGDDDAGNGKEITQRIAKKTGMSLTKPESM